MSLPWLSLASASIVALPLGAALLVLALSSARRPLAERSTARVVLGACALSSLALLVVTAAWLSSASPAMDVRLGTLFALPAVGGHEGYSLELGLRFDALSLTMALLTSALSFVVGVFSVRYLHREPGFSRYFVLLGVFVGAMQLLVLASSLDLLFAGWELVGVSSMLLIGFFHRRVGPTRAALRAMLTYRVTDVGILVAAVLIHHSAGTSEMSVAFANADGHGAINTVIACALLLSAMGKSALFPLGTWLPRAMEGPTPSSALFYGALSVHAGVYLLLRAAPLFATSPLATHALTVVGALTAITATMTGRTRGDVKSSLAYSTISHIGAMVVALSLGFWWLTLALLVGHCALRTLQLLRSPSALHDSEQLRAALQDTRRPTRSLWHAILPTRWMDALHGHALEDFHLDDALRRWVLGPVLTASRIADELERRWVALLTRESALDDHRVEPS